MYKFVYYSDTPIDKQIVALRKKFNCDGNTYFFKYGKHKGKDAIFVLKDLDTRVYGEPEESRHHPGCIFYPPASEINIESFERNREHREHKIMVELIDGVNVYIIPAQLEPKKVIFDFNEEVKTEDNPFSTATAYGRAAYEIFPDVDRGNLMLADPRVKKLVLLGLMRSYSLPIDIWNWMDVISVNDFDKLLSACLGINQELLEKKE